MREQALRPQPFEGSPARGWRADSSLSGEWEKQDPQTLTPAFGTLGLFSQSRQMGLKKRHFVGLAKGKRSHLVRKKLAKL